MSDTCTCGGKMLPDPTPWGGNCLLSRCASCGKASAVEIYPKTVRWRSCAKNLTPSEYAEWILKKKLAADRRINKKRKAVEFRLTHAVVSQCLLLSNAHLSGLAVKATSPYPVVFRSVQSKKSTSWKISINGKSAWAKQLISILSL